MIIINNFYYEDEFEEKLIELIKNNYGLKENEKSYMIMRFMIINDVKFINKIDLNEFINFIIKENNLPKDLVYKDSQVSLHRSDIQSMKNIIDNWFFEINRESYKNNLLNNKVNIENNISNIETKAKKEASNFRKNKFYKSICLYKALCGLNHLFGAKLDGFARIKYLRYPNSHNDLERYLEEKLLSRIESYEFYNRNSLDFISEKDLENYLKYNLNKIENGLKLVDIQHQLDDICLDILAKDKNDNYVIIELKIEQDERLIWQAIYYPMRFKEQYKDKKVRMISLVPKYENFLLKPLKTIEGIELFEYDLELEKKKIKNISVKKIK